MTIDEGATHEINSRWPEFKQRNVGMAFNFYGENFAKNMLSGITLVRDHHEYLKNSGATVWDMPKYMSDTLDDLAGI
jgi:hypothetical protein